MIFNAAYLKRLHFFYKRRDCDIGSTPSFSIKEPAKSLSTNVLYVFSYRNIKLCSFLI